jgi:hypothetical protein
MHYQRTMNQYVEGLSPACWCERHGPEKSTFVRVRAEGLDGYEIRCFKCETLKGKGCASIAFSKKDISCSQKPLIDRRSRAVAAARSAHTSRNITTVRPPGG